MMAGLKGVEDSKVLIRNPLCGVVPAQKPERAGPKGKQ